MTWTVIVHFAGRTMYIRTRQKKKRRLGPPLVTGDDSEQQAKLCGLDSEDDGKLCKGLEQESGLTREMKGALCVLDEWRQPCK